MKFFEHVASSLGEDEANRLVASFNDKPTHCLLLDVNKLDEERFISLYPKVIPHPVVPHAFYYEKEDYDFGKSLLYEAGAISIEDASAMLPFHFLAPKPGERVLDMCAAPGGKSVGLSLLMDGQGVILSNDVSYQRARSLSQNIERMGLGNLVVSASDFSLPQTQLAESFDAILLDAPCSGSAMFRKNPLAEADWSYEKVLSLAKKQAILLENAYFLLSPGGRLLYSTCSFSYEEDEGVIIPFLRDHPDMHIVPLKDDPSFYHHPDLPDAIHLFPHRFKGEGQFLALLKKDGEPKRSTQRRPNPIKDRDLLALIEEYPELEGRDNRLALNCYQSLSMPFDAKGLPLLRYGIRLFEPSSHLVPEHHLSHFLPSSYSIPLNKEQAEAYLRGESFPLEGGKGFRILSYDGLNLGYGKISQGVVKNHCPKGLRKKIEI